MSVEKPREEPKEEPQPEDDSNDAGGYPLPEDDDEFPYPMG